MNLSEIEFEILSSFEDSYEDLYLIENHINFYYCKGNASKLNAKQQVILAINHLYCNKLIELYEFNIFEVNTNEFEINIGNKVEKLDINNYLNNPSNWKSQVYQDKKIIYHFQITTSGIEILDSIDT